MYNEDFYSNAIRCLRPESERELGFAREIVADEALAFHLRDTETLVELGENNLHDESVARDHWTAKLHPVDPGEKEFFLRASFTYVEDERPRETRIDESQSGVVANASPPSRRIE